MGWRIHGASEHRSGVKGGGSLVPIVRVSGRALNVVGGAAGRSGGRRSGVTGDFGVGFSVHCGCFRFPVEGFWYILFVEEELCFMKLGLLLLGSVGGGKTSRPEHVKPNHVYGLLLPNLFLLLLLLLFLSQKLLLYYFEKHKLNNLNSLFFFS